MTRKVRRGLRVWTISLVLASLAAVLGLGVLALRPRDPLARSESAYANGEWQTAVAEARAALKVQPSDARALRRLARSLARLERDAAAEGIYRRLGAAKMEAEDFSLLGKGLLRGGKSTPAIAALRAARDLDPNHAETLDELARYWAAKGLTSDAAEAAERLSKQPGWEVRGLARLGPLLDDLHDPAGAARALSEALARDPQLAQAGVSPRDAHKRLAICLLEQEKSEEAGRELGADEPESAWLLSRVRLQQGKAKEAEEALKRADEFGESNPLRKEPSAFVGAAKCESCHADKYKQQQMSRHSRTIQKTAELSRFPWPGKAVVDESNPKVSHLFRKSGEGVEVVTNVGKRELAAIVEFAIGSNHQGQSFLARDREGQTRELRISRYPSDPVWDRTIEHPERPPDEEGYLGRPISAGGRLSCLECHATTFRSATEPKSRAEGADRGIGCERCHGPGGNHLRAVAMSFSDLAIARPRLASAEAVIGLCGECHKAPSAAGANGPGSIRFQAPNILRSRCYIESDGGMSCVTCHDPHKDADKSPSYYEAKCLTCHNSKSASVEMKKRAMTVCPVNPAAKCLNCHMPRVSDAVARSVFTDHFIRVRREP